MPTFALNVRPVDDAPSCGRGLFRGVDVASSGLDVAVFKVDVIPAVGVLDVVAELVLVDIDVDVDVEIIPSSVETIAPSPFKMMPRFSAQHFGSITTEAPFALREFSPSRRHFVGCNRQIVIMRSVTIRKKRFSISIS
jgi:hypothetical protein